MTTATTAKKDTQKLQRAIVDGLEDVKGQDIRVFNTEHLSPLFERVVVASGTSNRQTRALASSVRDAVRDAGFPKPRIEGEENGEWIIVDCGSAVAHIMQPAIRQYYNLEEIWGDKPVRLKGPEVRKSVRDSEALTGGRAAAKAAAVPSTEGKAPARKRAPAKKPAARKTAASEPVAPGVAGRSSPPKAKIATQKAASAKTAPLKAPPVKATPVKAVARKVSPSRAVPAAGSATAGRARGAPRKKPAA
jgi:ribosome-associated protein